MNIIIKLFYKMLTIIIVNYRKKIKEKDFLSYLLQWKGQRETLEMLVMKL
jgi:hypothetical protein